jgi:hypothetical protein
LIRTISRMVNGSKGSKGCDVVLCSIRQKI